MRDRGYHPTSPIGILIPDIGHHDRRIYLEGTIRSCPWHHRRDDTRTDPIESLANEKLPRQRPSDFDPRVLRLFDSYVHGLIDRRGFLDAAKLAVGGATAAGLLEALNPRFAEAQQIAPTDPRLKAEYIEIESPQGYGKVRGYLVRPVKPGGKLPLVLVVHENRGLNPHIEDVARRIALEKFVAFAPDALFPLGGYPGDEDKARELFAKLDQSEDARGLRRERKLPSASPRGQRQARRSWLLLRRRHRSFARDALAAATRGGTILRSCPVT